MTAATVAETRTATLEAIAQALGGTLRIEGVYEHRGVAQIELTDAGKAGPRLFITFGGDGKLYVRPLYPQMEGFGTVHPTYVLPYGDRNTWTERITISLTKSPAVIAREIERRLLVQYLPLYAQCQAYVDARMSERNHKRANRDRLAALLPGATDGPAWKRKEERDGTVMFSGRDGQPSVDAEVAHDGRVYSLTLRDLTVEQAEQVIRTLFPQELPF